MSTGTTILDDLGRHARLEGEPRESRVRAGEEEGRAWVELNDRHRQEQDADAGPGGPEASSNSTRVAHILFASLMSTA